MLSPVQRVRVPPRGGSEGGKVSASSFLLLDGELFKHISVAVGYLSRLEGKEVNGTKHGVYGHGEKNQVTGIAFPFEGLPYKHHAFTLLSGAFCPCVLPLSQREWYFVSCFFLCAIASVSLVCFLYDSGNWREIKFCFIFEFSLFSGGLGGEDQMSANSKSVLFRN